MSPSLIFFAQIVCFRFSHIFIASVTYIATKFTMTGHQPTDPASLELFLWSPKLKNTETYKAELSFHPQTLRITFNGFLQYTHLYTPRKEYRDLFTFQCPEGCTRCTGQEIGECIDCALGYYAIETSTGKVCLEYTAKKWMMVVITLITLLYVIRQWFPNRKILKFVCKNHKNELVTTVALTCGHMMCEECADMIQASDENKMCPICKSRIKKVLPINIE